MTALVNALNIPELKALGDEQITGYIQQRQAAMRNQLLDVVTSQALLDLDSSIGEEQKVTQAKDLTNRADTLRRCIAELQSALDRAPASPPPPA